ncbi:hypothetical protein U1Q18_017636, partial [Sarracenia purpurea var. burkii]
IKLQKDWTRRRRRRRRRTLDLDDLFFTGGVQILEEEKKIGGGGGDQRMRTSDAEETEVATVVEFGIGGGQGTAVGGADIGGRQLSF